MPELGHLRAIVGGVLRESLRASRRNGIVLLDDGSPEAALLGAWCAHEIGPDHIWPVTRDREAADSVEALRYRARVLAAERNALTAHPANKTALLLGSDWPVEPLLPLGDLYATQIAELAGGWSGSPEVCRLVEQVGGVEAADRALGAWLDDGNTTETALAGLPGPCRGPFLEAVRRGRFWRERAGLIPKLSARTIGIDLFA